MTTINALQAAVTGLNISQQLINVTAENTANANTAGYTTKTLPVTTQVAGGVVVGVDTGTIQRTVDTNLQTEMWTQTSTSGALSTINSYLGQVQDLYGAANAQTSFSAYLTNLNNDFNTLSSAPDSAIDQQQTVADAQTFANSLNQTASTITTLRNNAEVGIEQSVTSINTDLQQIATLNTQIAQATYTNQSTADLQDQRDDVVNSLSQQIGISHYINSNGVMVVQTTQGQPLVDTTAHTLIFNSQPLGSTTSYPSNGVSGVYIDSATNGVDLAASSATLGGTLGGLLQLRDQILPQQQAQVDELAEQTANRFQAQGLKLFTNPDGTIPANTPSTGAYAGFAGTITVNPAVVANPALVQQGTDTSSTPLQAGDNTIIDNVLNYTFGLNSDASGTPNVPFNTTNVGVGSNISINNLPSAATLQNFAQQIITVQAAQSSSYTTQQTFSDNYRDSLQTSLSNQSGVNLDNQVANLTLYQHSYEASAEIIQTAETLMNDLITAIQTGQG